MKKGVLIVDALLILIFVFMLISKFIDFPFIKKLQLVFFVLIAIHIAQHWKSIFFSFKKIFKTKK